MNEFENKQNRKLNLINFIAILVIFGLNHCKLFLKKFLFRYKLDY